MTRRRAFFTGAAAMFATTAVTAIAAMTGAVEPAAASVAQRGGVSFDFTIGISSIISVVVIIAGGLTVWITVRLQVAANARAIGDLKTALAALEAKVDEHKERIEQIRARSAKELDAFKLEVAREYATMAVITRVEERIADALEKLDLRLEKLDDRLAGMATTRPRPRSSPKQ